jgi:hypothetical protein
MRVERLRISALTALVMGAILLAAAIVPASRAGAAQNGDLRQACIAKARADSPGNDGPSGKRRNAIFAACMQKGGKP